MRWKRPSSADISPYVVVPFPQGKGDLDLGHWQTADSLSLSNVFIDQSNY
jgi:hypothetical protein